MHILIAPLNLQQTKKKKFLIGLNAYKPTHYLTLNRLKIVYKELMSKQIKALPVFNKVELIYILYPQTKRVCDIGNLLSVHDKFFCDALVEYGKLEDDNYIYIPKITFMIGEVDKINPRVTIEIKEIV